MYDLSSYPTEALKEELERREKLIKRVPQMLDDPHIDLIREAANAYIRDMVDGTCRHIDCDCEHYMFEEVMEAFYGPSVWTWLEGMNDLY